MFIDYCCRIRQDRQFPLNTGPAVVHCSAGVGRTGVFVLCDIAIDSLLATQAVDIPHIITQMREQRDLLVQVAQQYTYCYQVLVAVCDILLAEDNCPPRDRPAFYTLQNRRQELVPSPVKPMRDEYFDVGRDESTSNLLSPTSRATILEEVEVSDEDDDALSISTASSAPLRAVLQIGRAWPVPQPMASGADSEPLLLHGGKYSLSVTPDPRAAMDNDTPAGGGAGLPSMTMPEYDSDEETSNRHPLREVSFMPDSTYLDALLALQSQDSAAGDYADVSDVDVRFLAPPGSAAPADATTDHEEADQAFIAMLLRRAQVGGAMPAAQAEDEAMEETRL
jgi:hypothetical protein